MMSNQATNRSADFEKIACCSQQEEACYTKEWHKEAQGKTQEQDQLLSFPRKGMDPGSGLVNRFKIV